MNNKKRILITGVSGLLGSNLAFCLKDRYDILGLYHSRRISLAGISSRWADLRSFCHTEVILREFNPHVVIHCAAQADVDTCEVEPQRAVESNVVATANLVKCLENFEAKLIHISTDLVYGGTKQGLYSELDNSRPVNYYGITKLDAEREALKNERSLVLRTNFFGWGISPRRSLAQWLIEELKSGRDVQGFTDVYFSSLYTFDLAELILKMIDKNLGGIYNCGSANAISKYEFLLRLANKVGLDGTKVRASSIDQFSLKAKRAKNLSLNVTKLAQDLAIALPTSEESIDHFVADLNKDYPASMLSEIERTAYKPYLNFIPYGRQAIDESDVSAVADVLYSSNLTQGPKIEEFERKLAKYTGALFCSVVNSGTSALHLACLAAGVTAGDEVITSANTFVASANCAAYCGAKPIFADIDERTYNISVEDMEKKISAQTKVVIPVHFAGQSADMEAICQIVRRAEQKFGHKIYIIEDASHALGSLYQNQKVGAGTYSDMTIFSFHPVKHITTGEGGAVLTNDKMLHRQISLFRSHGITTFIDELTQKKEAFEPTEGDEENGVKRSWYYEQQHLGFNYRITDLQCALGIAQLKKLPEFITRRREVFEMYQQSFQGISFLQIPFEAEKCLSNFHLYVLLFDFQAIGKSRHQVIVELRNLGIHTQVHYIPCHTQPYYQKSYGTQWGDCPKTEAYYRRCLSIPLFPALTNEEVLKVVNSIKEVIGA
jgi:perosamine synthetase